LKLLIFLLVFSVNSVQAVEYLYQDITANTSPTRYCYPITKAKDLTTDRYNLDRFNKRFCSTLGDGWHVDKRKADGTPVCIPCTGKEEGNHQCYMENVVVSCKLVKPGSLHKGSNQ
jgi:hypothetical protein